ncbi:hypothetical protein PanWU01x14_246530 [Parasponia andersonii]|uniref:Uncharacterized protein n=1 Tax=Parasponia andersonii TaxID=3476 RepID=A0A2P5BED3_PARAD|nr:hypothetical protein PanWU01x14_246530 [Parasponia andersonii]
MDMYISIKTSLPLLLPMDQIDLRPLHAVKLPLLLLFSNPHRRRNRQSYLHLARQRKHQSLLEERRGEEREYSLANSISPPISDDIYLEFL